MEISRIATRIHPVMAVAAVSVIIVSLTGAAAITGLLPTSHSAPDAQVSAVAPAAQPYVATTGAPMPAQAGAQMAGPGQMAANYVQPGAAPQPQIIKEVVIKEVVKEKPVHHYHTAQHVAQNDAPAYAQQPAPAPAPAPAAQPNYVGIGTGALIGGILGNQVGSGNGRKLATVAGAIGGGMLGNEIANRTSNSNK